MFLSRFYTLLLKILENGKKAKTECQQFLCFTGLSFGCSLEIPRNIMYQTYMLITADWNLAVNGKKPFPIKGLDQ